MGTVNPRMRGDVTLSGVMTQAQDDREQIRRLLSQQKKPEKPGMGGIVDIASVYTSDYVGIQWASGASDLNFGSAAYAGPTSMVDGSTASWLTVTGGDIAVVEDGFYEAACFVDLRWSSQAAAPGPSLSIFLNGNPSGPPAPYHPIHQAGLLWGVVAQAGRGPEWMTAGQYWRLEADAGAASSAAITKSSASWQITRFTGA